MGLQESRYATEYEWEDVTFLENEFPNGQDRPRLISTRT